MRHLRLCMLLVLVLSMSVSCAPSADTPKPGGPFPGLIPPSEAEPGDEGPDMTSWLKDKSAPHWGPVPMFRADGDLVPALEKLLASDNAKWRARSAFLLGQIGQRRSVGALTGALKDKDPVVRLHAGVALSMLGDGKGLPACKEAIKVGHSPWVRYYAVYGLWRINSKESRQLLNEGLEGGSPMATKAAKAAIAAPYKRPLFGHRPGAKGITVKKNLTPDEIWLAAGDLFTREGDHWWHMGDYEQAIRSLEVGVFLDPEYADRYSSIAFLQRSVGREADAESALKRGVAAVPKSPEAHFDLGFYYFGKKKYAQAEPYLRRSVALGGDHNYRRTYAHCLEKLGKLSECEQQWEEVVESRPDDVTAKKNLDRVRALRKTGSLRTI